MAGLQERTDRAHRRNLRRHRQERRRNLQAAGRGPEKAREESKLIDEVSRATFGEGARPGSQCRGRSRGHPRRHSGGGTASPICRQRLTSLSDNRLTGLGEGLTAVAEGDLTVDANPVTTPLTAARGEQVGELGELFNGMLGQAQGGLESYNRCAARLNERWARWSTRSARSPVRSPRPRRSCRPRAQRPAWRSARSRPRSARLAEGAERQVTLVETTREAAQDAVEQRLAGARRRPAGRRADRGDRLDRRPDQPPRAQRRDRGRPRR